VSQCNKRGETPLDKCKPYLAEILRGEEITKNIDHGFCSPFLLIILLLKYSGTVKLYKILNSFDRPSSPTWTGP